MFSRHFLSFATVCPCLHSPRASLFCRLAPCSRQVPDSCFVSENSCLHRPADAHCRVHRPLHTDRNSSQASAERRLRIAGQSRCSRACTAEANGRRSSFRLDIRRGRQPVGISWRSEPAYSRLCRCFPSCQSCEAGTLPAHFHRRDSWGGVGK